MHVNEAPGPLDRTMAALAHPTRRAILERVMRREARVTELAAPFDLSLNAVSKHIQVLEKAGLLRRRRVWREHLVSFDARPLSEVSAWLEQTRTFWNSKLDALEAVLKADAEHNPKNSRNSQNPQDSQNPQKGSKR